jgi:hypothetical protein
MSIIRKPTPLARPFANGAVLQKPKKADAIYASPAYRAWARYIVTRAGMRCEAVDDGVRCTKTAPQHRIFADHIVELQDGGAPFDPANGACCCYSHHTVKTMRERAKRMGR